METFFHRILPFIANQRRLLYFLESGNHGVSRAINRAVFVDGEDQWTRQHQPEIAAGNDFVALNFVGAVNGVSAETDVRLAILEFGVDRAGGIAVLTLGTAAARSCESCAGQHGDKKRLANP